ncbi:hypothetical protein BBJ28_00018492 [Nothophytophthora sp. Chile5]|nr:hypothetical protein BBJ28_00018492 [Nothophytophthora sp. Chile5]
MAAVHVLRSSGDHQATPPAPRAAKRRRVSVAEPGVGGHSPDAVASPPSERLQDVKMTSDEEEEEEDEAYDPREQDKGNHLRGTCGECHVVFDSGCALTEHGREMRHRPFACRHEGCAKSYSKREHLTRHVVAVHERGSTHAIEERKPFKCELCQARFTYKHGLTRHANRSHRNLNTPFECAACLLAFKKKSDLQAHSYVHTGVLPFECEDCGVRFLKRFLLVRHQRTHAAHRASQTQVFVCETSADCGEIFFSLEEREEHERTAHDKPDPTNDKDGDCAVETKQATLPKLLCRVCDRTFQRKHYLRAHLRTHFESLDERKQYTCPMAGCSKSYTRRSNLMTHYNAVHDERKSQRFACPRDGCTVRFGYKISLTRHIEKIHDHPQPPKRRECKSASVFARALGVNQVGELSSANDVVVNGEATAEPMRGDEDEQKQAMEQP